MSENATVITHHASDRAWDRLGLKPDSVQRLANMAFANGIRQEDTAGSQARYLGALFMQEKTANNLRVYGDAVFIFVGNVLVTAHHLPHRYRETVRKIKLRMAKGAA